MKTIINFTLAATLLIGSTTTTFAQWGNKKVVGNGNIIESTIKTGGYDEIKVVGSMDVHLERGTEGNIIIKTDENLHDYVTIEIKGDALVIKTENNVYLKTKNGIHITVPFKDISEVALTGSGDIDTKDAITGQDLNIKLTGSGDIELDVNGTNVRSTVTGSGDIELKGTATNLNVTVTGSGDFGGYDLIASNTNVKVSGSGDAQVYAKDSIKARVNGSGDIGYKGNPERSDTKENGSGDISKH